LRISSVFWGVKVLKSLIIVSEQFTIEVGEPPTAASSFELFDRKKIGKK
jgi:hypothetical protein